MRRDTGAKLVGFYSASGGVGRSSVIIGLSWLLSCPNTKLGELREILFRHEKSFNIGLIDFDFEAPSLIYYANIDKLNDIKLKDLNKELSSETWNIRSFFTLVFWGKEPRDNDIIPINIGCGDHTLPSLLSPFDIDSIVHIHYTWGSSIRRRAFLADQMKHVLNGFAKKRNLNIIFGDLRNGLGLVTQDVLANSDIIVVVARPDPLSLSRLYDSIALILDGLRRRSKEYYENIKSINWILAFTHIDPEYHDNALDTYKRFSKLETRLVESSIVDINLLPASVIPWVKKLGGRHRDINRYKYYIEYLNTLNNNIDTIIDVFEYINKLHGGLNQLRLFKMSEINYAIKNVVGRDSDVDAVDIAFVNGLAVLADAILRSAGVIG
ncbi:MAG: hypothetical protein F7C08_00155 [Desulfurococcales archaeon]|nr:hypothetical protein [Desulfurococcales archaeon]